MATNAEHVLLDTSAALALVLPESPFHQAATRKLVACRRGLSGHAAVEMLSVLTRLPAPQRLNPATALHLIVTNFPESRWLTSTDIGELLQEFAALGLAGGALYDGLVAAAAREHQLTLITCDKRAEKTYRALGTNYELLQVEPQF